MKNLLTISVATVALAAFAPRAEADADLNVKHSHETGSGFGLGLMVGGPTGLSGKLYTGGPAIGFGIGGLHSHHDHHVHGVTGHVDALWHPAILARGDGFVLPLYLGVGARMATHDDHTDVGPRVPLGVALEFTRAPADIFFEMAFDLTLVSTHDHDHGHAGLSGALGARYYF